MPLRPSDIAEMEYRENYIDVDADVISQWAEAHHPNTYAGYYVDHRAGGIIHVGFTSGQATAVAELKQAAGLLASDRIEAFPNQPAHPYSELASLQTSIAANDATHAPLQGSVTRVGIDMQSNAVTVGATNVAAAQSRLLTVYGGQAPISVYQDTQNLKEESLSTKWTDEGPLRNGQAIGFWPVGATKPYWCTAGWGASERTGTKKNGAAILSFFSITAGHCFPENFVVRRFHSKEDKKPNSIGTVRRRSNDFVPDGFKTDGEAIELNAGVEVARTIVGEGHSTIPAGGEEVAKPGDVVCISGATAIQLPECKPILGHPDFYIPEIGPPEYVFHTELFSEPGDSGAPIWSSKTGAALGINVVGGNLVEYFIPLLPPRLPETGIAGNEPVKRDKAPGLLHAPGMGNMHITTPHS